MIGSGAAIVAAVALIVGYQARTDAIRRTPAWTDDHQPPEGIVSEPTETASYYAARPGLPDCRAGNRIMRCYEPRLSDASCLVRGV